MPSLSAAAFIEKLLEAEGPIWYRWDRDLTTLQNGLIAAAGSVSSTAQNEAPGFAVRQELVLWLLDRLAPETDSALFEDHQNHPRGIYARGRRLAPERRDELIRVPLPPGLPDNWNRRIAWQAVIFAWCDSCPDSQLSSLLDELDVWIPALSKQESWYLGEPVDEFYRRCTEEPVRQQQLVALLQRCLPLLEHQSETTRKFAGEVALRAWLKLVQSTALSNPAGDEAPHREEDWDSYFDNVLSQPSFSVVAELGRDLIQSHPHLKAMGHPDRDWAACAYQNYLAKAPEPILQHWFRLFDDLPLWQLEA